MTDTISFHNIDLDFSSWISLCKHTDQYDKDLHLLTYLLTYSMLQSPSWEANWFAASQEILRILWNPKVHHRTHKRLILQQKFKAVSEIFLSSSN